VPFRAKRDLPRESSLQLPESIAQLLGTELLPEGLNGFNDSPAVSLRV
jgi:hypothetical protein